MRYFQMKEPKPLRGKQFLRTMGIASFISAVCGFGTGSALACDGIKDSFKKTEQGFGELLKGIGQEAKKAGEVAGVWPRKEAKEESKGTEKQPDKGKEDHK
jgi:hypothetical protein